MPQVQGFPPPHGFYALLLKAPRGVPWHQLPTSPKEAELGEGSMRKRLGGSRGDHRPPTTIITTFSPATARPSPGSPGTRPEAIESDFYSVHQP